jgi:hypothetical protein
MTGRKAKADLATTAAYRAFLLTRWSGYRSYVQPFFDGMAAFPHFS